MENDPTEIYELHELAKMMILEEIKINRLDQDTLRVIASKLGTSSEELGGLFMVKGMYDYIDSNNNPEGSERHSNPDIPLTTSDRS